jgi:hypothetical protein
MGKLDLLMLRLSRRSKKIRKVYAEYAPQDNLNFDESRLFGL